MTAWPGEGKLPGLVTNKLPEPPNGYRVFGWHTNDEGRLDPWVEGDFVKRKDAVICADTLMAAGAFACGIYNGKGNTVYGYRKGGPGFEHPMSVTRMSGQKDPMKRKVGSHNRR